MPDVARLVTIPDALAVARQLSFPRQSGSEGDRRAIELVRTWFEATGLEVSEEWFSYDIRPAFRALRLLLVTDLVLVLAASLVVGRVPLTSLLLLLVAFCGSGVFLVWAPWLERLYRREGRVRTANLEARRRASDPRMTVIILAHHDSKSQNLSLPFRGLFTVLAIVSALSLVGLSGAGVLVGSAVVPVGLALGFGLVAAVCLGSLATLHNGNASPGGVDNAGSVGLVIELAHRLPREVPDDVELVFLSPGAEEDHMVGAMRWLDRHAGTLRGRPIWAINIDGAGIPGKVTLLERYGFGTMFSQELSVVAREVAAGLGTPLRGILIPPAMGVDAIPFVHRGIPCLTLASGSLGRASLSVHSKNDRFEHLEPSVLEQTAKLIRGMVTKLTRCAP